MYLVLKFYRLRDFVRFEKKKKKKKKNVSLFPLESLAYNPP